VDSFGEQARRLTKLKLPSQREPQGNRMKKNYPQKKTPCTGTRGEDFHMVLGDCGAFAAAVCCFGLRAWRVRLVAAGRALSGLQIECHFVCHD